MPEGFRDNRREIVVGGQPTAAFFIQRVGNCLTRTVLTQSVTNRIGTSGLNASTARENSPGCSQCS